MSLTAQISPPPDIAFLAPDPSFIYVSSLLATVASNICNRNAISSYLPGSLIKPKTLRQFDIAIHDFYPYFYRLVNFAKQKENLVNTISNKTFTAKPSTIEKKWVLVDAEDQPLGRLSSRIAAILRGKNKPEFTPHMDVGDNVVVINSEKVALSGKKMTDKQYFRHTGYPGGEIFTSAAEMMEKDPTLLIHTAVKGMLPKNKLGRKLMKNIRIFAGPVHNLTAQTPEKIEID